MAGKSANNGGRPNGDGRLGGFTPGSVRLIPIKQIQVEPGLGRRRDRDGHHELCASIERFGVLTPITLRRDPSRSGRYLLIKGQGRTLACQVLGLKTIPAVVVDSSFSETEKVQQFLVENVARLRMRPVDRALLISYARGEGEETVDVARRFGVAASTVRRLEAQLGGASSGEVAALRSGALSLAVQGVIARHVRPDDREMFVEVIAPYGLRASELHALLVAVGWRALSDLGQSLRDQRMKFIAWACSKLSAVPRGDIRERIRQLASDLPLALPATKGSVAL